MTTYHTKRINTEITNLLYDSTKYLFINNKQIASIDDVDDINTRILYCNICGPDKSPYENGIFKISIKLPENYPFEPPTIKFITPIYHPNLYSKTHFTLLYEDDWTPSQSIQSLIITIYSLMAEPLKCLICDESNNIDNNDTTYKITKNKQKIINIFLNDYQEWKKRAKECTNEYAIKQLWNISNHKLFINKKTNKHIIYLLWLGKQFEDINSIMMDVWIIHIMPYIIGKVGLDIITRNNPYRYNNVYSNLSNVWCGIH
jgi:ubiquitin-protein ligase